MLAERQPSSPESSGHRANYSELGKSSRPQCGSTLARKEGLSTTEREELGLRRQVKQLQTERDILAKATAWFAGRRGVTPTSSSNS